MLAATLFGHRKNLLGIARAASACVLTKAIVCRAGFARASFAEKKQLTARSLSAGSGWVLMIKLA